MGKTVKPAAGTRSKSARDNQAGKRMRTVVLPGADQWERWDQDGGTSWQHTASASTPAALGVSRAWVFGVPAAGIATLPLTVTAPDYEALEGAASLQLERRGLAEDGVPTTVVEVAVDGEQRRGIAISLLNDALQPRDAVAAEHCVVAGRVRHFPPWSLVFWQELGSTIMGITQGDGLAYFHTLGNGNAGSLLLRARCQVLWLTETGWLEGVRQIVRMPGAPDVQPLAHALSLPCAEDAAPGPSAAPHQSSRWQIAPAAVTERGRQVSRGRRIRTGLMASVAVVAVGAGLLAADYVRIRIALAAERAWLEKNDVDLSQIRAAAGRWDELVTAISPEAFPLELLQRSASLLPAEGARFTSFDWSDGVLTINGESVNPDLAYRYLTALKENPQTAETLWTMPQPKLQTNDLATFDIKGVTPYAQVETQ